MNPRRLNMMAFLLACSAITYWHVKKCKELPWPPQFIATGIVFVLLDLFSAFNEELSGITSIGFVIAIFVKQGWIADCSHKGIGGTAQPQTASFINTTQTPAISLVEFQQQTQGGPVPGGTGVTVV